VRKWLPRFSGNFSRTYHHILRKGQLDLTINPKDLSFLRTLNSTMDASQIEGLDLDPTSRDEFLGMFSLGDDLKPVAAKKKSEETPPIGSVTRLWLLATGGLPEDEMDHTERQVFVEHKPEEVHLYTMMLHGLA